jgi:hypothetical protein
MRAQRPVGDRAWMLLLQAREELFRGALGLGLEPGAQRRPHLFERVFARAPKARRARGPAMGRSDFALLPRRREILDEGVQVAAGRLGPNRLTGREPREPLLKSPDGFE